MGERREISVQWMEEEQTLTLEGEQVLRYQLSWPQIQGGGLGGRWISRYYAALADSWRRRWRRQVYCRACLDLAVCRAQSRPFRPWQGELRGEVALLEGELLSLRLMGCETAGDGRTARVRWGEMWQVRQGMPVSVGQLMKGQRGWKKRLWQALVDSGQQRRQGGDCFLDPDWAEKAKRCRPLEGGCLTPEGLEVSLPQCAAAPAAEGCPVFLLPLERTKDRPGKGRWA